VPGMREFWTTDRVRIAEQKMLDRMPPGVVMRRESFVVAQRAAEMLAEHAGRIAAARVALLVGSGDNGGDALWAGAMLRRRGVCVTAVLLSPERAHAEGLAALRRARGRVVLADYALPALERADLVVDGIVGLSARGGLRPAAARLVSQVTAPLLAVDLPSGVNPDTGFVEGEAVRATSTVTFGAYKPVHVLAAGRCGDVRLVDLGLRPELGEPDLTALDAADVARAWPVPRLAHDKSAQGVTGIVAGSSSSPGAAVLAAGGAVQSTSGTVRYAGPAAGEVRARWPEVITIGSFADADRVQAWVVSSGSGTGADARQTLRDVLSAGVPVCADADATTMIAEHPELLDARAPDTPLVLTPHDHEFERLAGPVGNDRVAAVVRAARQYRAVVLSQGDSTVIADAEGRVNVQHSGRSSLATPGSGDVLPGIIGALLGAGLEPLLAASCAAMVRDEAAAIATSGASVPSSTIVAAIPEAIRGLQFRTSPEVIRGLRPRTSPEVIRGLRPRTSTEEIGELRPHVSHA